MNILTGNLKAHHKLIAFW